MLCKQQSVIHPNLHSCLNNSDSPKLVYMFEQIPFETDKENYSIISMCIYICHMDLFGLSNLCPLKRLGFSHQIGPGLTVKAFFFPSK